MITGVYGDFRKVGFYYDLPLQASTNPITSSIQSHTANNPVVHVP